MTHTRDVVDGIHPHKTFCGLAVNNMVLAFWFDVECKKCAKAAFEKSKTHDLYQHDEYKKYKILTEENYKKRCFNVDIKNLLS